MSCLLALLIYAIWVGICWLGACGIYYMIALCFGWVFSWQIATGFWLLWLVLCSIFRDTHSSSKK